MIGKACLDSHLASARPKAVAALLRHFRDLDVAEDAFQEACLRALKTWPDKGLPRDAASWLIRVGKNAAIDHFRRASRLSPLQAEDACASEGDIQAELPEAMDRGVYRDDILRLLFICCHPELGHELQIALALKVVSGLSLAQIARAFLVSEAAMEQRITRAKSRIAKGNVPFETPGASDRIDRVAAVSAMIYLLFNEGYSADAGHDGEKSELCTEAIRLSRLLLSLFQDDPEILGLTALLLLQHSRRKARFSGEGTAILLEDQDRTRWDRVCIDEGCALIGKGRRVQGQGPYLLQAEIAACHAVANKADDTDWVRISSLYAELEFLQPTPVVTLNRAVAIFKAHGAAAALSLIDPLEPYLRSYFYFHGARATFLEALGRDSEAQSALDSAFELAPPAIAAHVQEKRDRLGEKLRHQV